LHPFSDFDALPSGDGDITDRPCDFPTNFASYLAHAVSPLFQPFVYFSSTCLLLLVYLPRPTSLQPADLPPPFEPSVNTATLQITHISPCVNSYRSLFAARHFFVVAGSHSNNGSEWRLANNDWKTAAISDW
jgi:hypothetical protein